MLSRAIEFLVLDGGSILLSSRWRAGSELEMAGASRSPIRGGVYGAGEISPGLRKDRGQPIIGRRAPEVDGEEIVTSLGNLERSRKNLCRLLSFAHSDQPKGEKLAPTSRSRRAARRSVLPQRDRR